MFFCLSHLLTLTESRHSSSAAVKSDTANSYIRFVVRLVPEFTLLDYVALLFDQVGESKK